MKKGIRCNDTRFTDGKNRDRIRYEFVTEDGITASSCTVCLGDVDPLTGEAVTDVTFFREYYRVVDHQVHGNLHAENRTFTQAEEAWREQERKAFILAFEKKWGYPPSADDVLYHLDQRMEQRHHLSLESVVFPETGESALDWRPEFSVPAETDREESVEMQALREVAGNLTGRKAEVYEAMIQRAAGGQERLRFMDIARKWGVKKQQIEKDRRRIMEMVRRRAEEIRREDGEERE